jgi:phage terminase Nu1 subunit (DNA packaging protein)
MRQVSESPEVATRHVGNVRRQLEKAGRRLSRLDSDVDQLSKPQAPSQKRNEAPT